MIGANLPEKDNLTIRYDETEKLRDIKRKKETSDPWSPIMPGMGEFWKTRFRNGDELVYEEMPMSLKLGLSPEAR